MKLRKYRWSRHYESAEEELVALLATKHIDAERWTADGAENLEPSVSTADKQIWCAEGSIVFTVGNQKYSLQPGDALDVPAGANYEATAGISGCVCYES
jgi:mannose-6-phosphate isomerase class I